MLRLNHFSTMPPMADADAQQKVVPVTLELSPRARDVVAGFKEHFGVTQKAGIERGLEFLASLPREVLRDVLTKGADPIGRLVRLKMAEEAGAAGESNLEQAIAILRQQLDRVENLARAYRAEVEDAGSSGSAVQKAVRATDAGRRQEQRKK